jgi:hypothetical protein
MGFAQAMARHAGSHEIWIALSGLFPETIEPLRAAFEGLVPQKQLVVWRTVPPVAAREASTDWKREIGERVREAFLADLKPDVIHVSSLFEGFVDNAVTSVGRFLSCTVLNTLTIHRSSRGMSANLRTFDALICGSQFRNLLVMRGSNT